MKNYTPEELLGEIGRWRSLEELITNAIPGSNIKKASNQLAEIRCKCCHRVYVHLSTRYVDDGLGSPEFYSTYRCVVCGSTAYDVPALRLEPDTCCINMHLYDSTQNYSDAEKFGIAEFQLKQLIEDNPQYTTKQIVRLLNDRLAKK